ncbi:hypothetical protein MMC07_005034 [Pseudocyphellaria aurata]|nr:hypothetical protein [Pseudocyphellaria aurata]
MTSSITSSDVLISTSPSPLSRKRKRDSASIAELEVDINAPEPLSKKGLRKAKKSKTSNTNTESHSIIEAAEAEGLVTSPVPKRSDYGIWIGNLPWSASKIDVREFITANTNIADAQITRLHMPAPREDFSNTPKSHGPKIWNKGFAYVDFSTTAALAQAMALTETLLKGRRLLIKDSKSFEGRPQKSATKDGLGPAATGPGKPASKRIFVGNLGFDTSEEDLREHFERCGPVVHVHMATFEDSGKCKGFAWVEFENLTAAKAAVRGWVEPESVQQDEEDEEDEEKEEEEEENGKLTVKSDDDDDGDKAADNKDHAAPSKAKKAAQKKKIRKPRKWWINKIHGRLVRMEFAEDKTVRYKKRYNSKGSARKEEAGSESNDAPTTAVAAERAMAEKPDLARSLLPSASSDPTSQVVYSASHPPRLSTSSHPTSHPTTKPVSIPETIVLPAVVDKTPVARLTGGIVASKGRKTIFA